MVTYLTMSGMEILIVCCQLRGKACTANKIVVEEIEDFKVSSCTCSFEKS